jgi:hypothetical protein
MRNVALEVLGAREAGHAAGPTGPGIRGRAILLPVKVGREVTNLPSSGSVLLRRHSRDRVQRSKSAQVLPARGQAQDLSLELGGEDNP